MAKLFIILNSYLGQIPHYLIYIWQGRHANIDEVTASAYLAVQLRLFNIILIILNFSLKCY